MASGWNLCQRLQVYFFKSGNHGFHLAFFFFFFFSRSSTIVPYLPTLVYM